MNFEDISSSWAKDGKIDQVEIGREAVTSPQLLSKYLNFWTQVKQQRSKQDSLVKALRRDKFLFYSGKATSNEYMDHKFADLRLNSRDDIRLFVDADEGVRREEEKLERMDQAAWFLEQVVKSIHSRDWALKLALEHEKFITGS